MIFYSVKRSFFLPKQQTKWIHEYSYKVDSKDDCWNLRVTRRKDLELNITCILQCVCRVVDNGRWTKQQSIKTKLGSVRRIPSIKLGTSKYPARRTDEKGERMKRWIVEELVQDRGRHSSRGGSRELASISRIRAPKTKSYLPPPFPSNSWLSSSFSLVRVPRTPFASW